MTTSEITIDRAVVRYEMDAASRGQQPRFDRILAEDVGSGLETALDQVMWRLGRDAIVCVKRLEIALCLDLSAPDRVLADVWSDAVAAAVMDLFDRGGDDVIVYRTLAQPLNELAEAALGGSDFRAWAWNQLGLWTSTDGAGPAGYTHALGRAARALPRFAPRVLVDAVRRDRTMLRRLTDDAPAIARAVLCNAGLPELAATRLIEDAVANNLTLEPVGQGIPAWSRAEGGVIREALQFYQLPTPAARAWAIIGLADSEPVQLQRDTAAATVDNWLSGIGRRSAVRVEEPVETRPADVTWCDSDTSGARSEDQTLTPQPIDTAASAVLDDALPAEPTDVVPASDLVTEWGGLLFVLNLVDDAVLGMLASAPMRPALITTAALLTGAPEDDPGVQAFAGCLGTVGPSQLDSPVNGVDRRDDLAMAGPRNAAASLRNRLADLGFTDAACVMQRRAVLRAAPGWLEAEFSIDDVDLDVRRAGLDIDPDWLPWLGVVVTFRYG